MAQELVLFTVKIHIPADVITEGELTDIIKENLDEADVPVKSFSIISDFGGYDGDPRG